jgi:hypothetical protein
VACARRWKMRRYDEGGRIRVVLKKPPPHRA